MPGEMVQVVGVSPVSRCVFMQQLSPYDETIARCHAPAERVVLVPVKAAGGMFLGAGVRAEVCLPHAHELCDKYGGVLV